jgi:hypothetical protein
MNDDPTTTIITRTRTHIGESGIAVSLLSTLTGIGYYRLRRVLKGETGKLSLNDARRLEEYLSGEAA